MSRETFFKSRFCLGLVTPKSRLGLGLGPLRLDSGWRRCSDVSKIHKYCKCVTIFGKNWLFVHFLANQLSLILPLATVELNHGNLYAWQSRSLDTAYGTRETIDLFLSNFIFLIKKFGISNCGFRYITMFLMVVNAVLRHYIKLHV